MQQVKSQGAIKTQVLAQEVVKLRLGDPDDFSLESRKGKRLKSRKGKRLKSRKGKRLEMNRKEEREKDVKASSASLAKLVQIKNMTKNVDEIKNMTAAYKN